MSRNFHKPEGAQNITPCSRLCEKLNKMTSRWHLLAVALVTSCFVFCNAYLTNLVLFDQNKPTSYFTNYTTDTGIIIPEYNKESFINSIKNRSCPIEYFSVLARDREYAENLQTRVESSQMNYSYQTHLTKDVLYSNHSMISYVNLNIPMVFNTSFVNPCWYSEVSDGDRELRCLPHFFLAGFPKSGTTDLFYKMSIHPQILVEGKEPHWWTRKRYPEGSGSGMPLYKYVNKFQYLSTCLQSLAELHLPRPVRLVTGDGSASTLWDNRIWDRLPGNDDLEEPRVLNADHIRHFLPASKIIVIVRDPVDRLFSGYAYFWKQKGKPSPDDFHNKVVDAIKTFTECQQIKPTRACAYSQAQAKIRLTLGMYSVYMKDWFRIFPKNQIHILRTEDYDVSLKNELKKIFSFLELDPLHDSVFDQMEDIPHANVFKPKKTRQSMFPETRIMLKDFYASYNKELAALLNNTDYLWKDET